MGSSPLVGVYPASLDKRGCILCRLDSASTAAEDHSTGRAAALAWHTGLGKYGEDTLLVEAKNFSKIRRAV